MDDPQANLNDALNLTIIGILKNRREVNIEWDLKKVLLGKIAKSIN